MGIPGGYDASPHMADTPVSAEEVEMLLVTEGKNFIKDGRKVLHFLRRVDLTIKAYRTQIQGLARGIQELQNQQSASGQPSTMSPLDAIKYVAPQQLAMHVESHIADRLTAAEKALADANRNKQSSMAELNKVRFAVATLLEDPSMSEGAKRAFKDLMRSLPAGAGPVAGPSAGQGNSQAAGSLQSVSPVVARASEAAAERTMARNVEHMQPPSTSFPAPPPPPTSPPPGRPGVSELDSLFD